MLINLLVFVITGEVMKCTKYLINREHTHTLWIDKAYLTHVKDNYALIDLSMKGEDVSHALKDA